MQRKREMLLQEGVVFGGDGHIKSESVHAFPMPTRQSPADEHSDLHVEANPAPIPGCSGLPSKKWRSWGGAPPFQCSRTQPDMAAVQVVQMMGAFEFRDSGDPDSKAQEPSSQPS